jgi:hypothetical protein
MEHQHTPKSPEPSSTAVGAFVTNTAPTSKDFQEAVAKGYEPHDIGLRMVFIFLGGLTVTMIVVLAFVYAVMMAMAEHDRTNDGIASPVKVNMPAIYAPLQPSLGFNGNHDFDHDVLDADDMVAMRYVTAQELDHEGTTAAGRHHIAIDTAMDEVISKSLLVSKPVLAPTTEPVISVSLHEGSRVGVPKKQMDPNEHVNDMNSLNLGDN